jgi:hypothetical protein
VVPDSYGFSDQRIEVRAVGIQEYDNVLRLAIEEQIDKRPGISIFQPGIPLLDGYEQHQREYVTL